MVISRADRRRQLREDQERLRHGLDAAYGDGDDLEALARIVRDKVRVAVDRRSVSGLMHFLFENMEAGTKHLAEVPVACGKGCAHCCTIWVDAMPPEVFYTVGTMNRRQRDAALVSVEAALEITEGKTFDERADMVTPCPLLVDTLCSVYSTRPTNCRTAVSTDAGVCERSYVGLSGEGIPTPAVWHRLRSGYGSALQCALEDAGLVGTPREWNGCLRIALSDPDAEARWFAGEDVFADVQMVAEPPAARAFLADLAAHAFS